MEMVIQSITRKPSYREQQFTTLAEASRDLSKYSEDVINMA